MDKFDEFNKENLFLESHGNVHAFDGVNGITKQSIIDAYRALPPSPNRIPPTIRIFTDGSSTPSITVFPGEF